MNPNATTDADVKSSLRWLVLGLILAGFAWPTLAHVGSPNIFFQGEAGPYPLRVTIEPPGVIPGTATVVVRTADSALEQVRVRPARWDAGLDGAPPLEVARPVRGASGLFTAELWLMTTGSYYIEVEASGPSGSGSVMVPITAVASERKTMTAGLGTVLLLLGGTLFISAVILVGIGVGQSTLAVDAPFEKRLQRRSRWAMLAASFVLASLTYGGKTWWDRMDAKFVAGLFEPYSMQAEIPVIDDQRLLRLTIDDERWMGRGWTPLFPDHGKLMHVFLVRQDTLDVLAHLHPTPRSSRRFRAPLPLLPSGTYSVYADITQESGLAQTLTATVEVPSESPHAAEVIAPDPDDSYRLSPAFGTLPPSVNPRVRTSHLSDCVSLRLWIEGSPTEGDAIGAEQDLTLHAEAIGPDGAAISLEPYMGMLGHAAIRRDDGAVFAHLHPTGSISMASQQAFLQRQHAAVDPHAGHTMDDLRVQQVSFPYAFPRPGNYRVWIQVKIAGRVETGAFDLTVY